MTHLPLAAALAPVWEADRGGGGGKRGEENEGDVWCRWVVLKETSDPRWVSWPDSIYQFWLERLSHCFGTSLIGVCNFWLGLLGSLYVWIVIRHCIWTGGSIVEKC